MSPVNTFLLTHCFLQIIGWISLKFGIIKKNKIKKVNNTILLLIILIVIWLCITVIPMFLIGIYASKLKSYAGWGELLLINLGFIVLSLSIMLYSSFTGVYDLTKNFDEDGDNENTYQSDEEDEDQENNLIKGNKIIYESEFFDVLLMINLIFLFSLSILYKS